MKANIDFDKVGKRMPYTVPDDFFTEMEDNIWKEVKKSPVITVRHKLSYLRVVMKTIAAIAAVVVLFFIFKANFSKSHTTEFSDIERAFSNLSHEDQAYMLAVYQDDVFINE